ncbi:MAG: hypothetical protein SFY95_07080 [Planctomycetota bacterium]|nr:hypothetical protein [Planctomycetota bacterium]
MSGDFGVGGPGEFVHASAPPTTPTILPERPSWAGAIGWISVVLGGLGILGNTCGVAGTLLAKPFQGFMRSLAANAPQAQLDVMDVQMAAQARFMPAMAVISALSLVVSILLLVAGVKLLKQQADTVKLHRIWAIARLALGMAGMVVGFLMQNATTEAMKAQNLGGAAGAGAAFGEIAGMIGIIVGAMWAAAWPLFVLIWFSRAKVLDEVRTWQGASNNA